MSRIVIVHRWQGSPNADWYPWLRKELEKQGHEAIIPAMPDPNHPNIHAWLGCLVKMVGGIDEHTFFVGHSMGCQAILRYLAHTPNNGVAGGVVLVAPWTRLKPESYENPTDEAIARPWLEMPIPWDVVKSRSKKFFCLFSDNDPFVLADENKVFEKKVNAKTLVEKGKGHFTQYDKCVELPIVLNELESMMR
ncbi:MAG: alpha/beta fold hydrolase [Candidatus Diapherotrites archaeon]